MHRLHVIKGNGICGTGGAHCDEPDKVAAVDIADWATAIAFVRIFCQMDTGLATFALLSDDCPAGAALAALADSPSSEDVVLSPAFS